MKTFLPPFIAFVAFAVIVWLQSLIHPMLVGDMGKGNLHAFMACFYFCFPLYFLTALFTQGLIVVPIWNGWVYGSAIAKLLGFLITCVGCFIAAGILSYLIWDKATGYSNFIGPALIMYLIQMAYWLINFFVMLLFNAPVKVEPVVIQEAH